ncbi:MAG: type II toxin-antitoxin system prevent-host-death family antitoxin [Crocosphaera sp.]|nr:type II toxin-antitoxin system prevent-host-death family antitoxin [Crocosphaera sp.]
METIDINQALPKIEQLLEIAATGEKIIITKNNQPMVKLTSIQPSNQDISLSKDFDKTLEDLIKQSSEQDEQLTPEERTQNWLAFLETLPKQSANLPDEALHRDTMYD